MEKSCFYQKEPQFWDTADIKTQFTILELNHVNHMRCVIKSWLKFQSGEKKKKKKKKKNLNFLKYSG